MLTIPLFCIHHQNVKDVFLQQGLQQVWKQILIENSFKYSQDKKSVKEYLWNISILVQTNCNDMKKREKFVNHCNDCY